MGGRGAASRGGRGGSNSGGGTPRTKSSIGVQRDSIKSSVSGNLKGKVWSKTIRLDGGGKSTISIGVDKDGIKHVSNDILKFRVISEKDIPKLAGQLKNSSYVAHSGLKHPRKDNIDHFYYFKARGKNLYFNVGRKTNRNGNVHYELYSITEKI